MYEKPVFILMVLPLMLFLAFAASANTDLALMPDTAQQATPSVYGLGSGEASYIVTIPARVGIEEGGEALAYTVSLSLSTITSVDDSRENTSAMHLRILVSSENYDSGCFYVKYDNGNQERLRYHIYYKTPDTEATENDFCIIDSVEEEIEDFKAVLMYFVLDVEAVPECIGYYRDVLTFRVEEATEEETTETISESTQEVLQKTTTETATEVSATEVTTAKASETEASTAESKEEAGEPET